MSCDSNGSETWALRKAAQDLLERTEMRMLRWTVGIKMIEKIEMVEREVGIKMIEKIEMVETDGGNKDD